MENILYEHVYYIIKETKKPKYLDFYELTEKDLKDPEIYLEQTIRYNDKWFFITTGKQYFATEISSLLAPKIFIKYLYRPKEELKIYP